MLFARRTERAVRAEAVLREVLAVVPDPHDYLRVAAEVRAWSRFLDVPNDAKATVWLEAALVIKDAQERGWDESRRTRELQGYLPFGEVRRRLVKEAEELRASELRSELRSRPTRRRTPSS